MRRRPPSGRPGFALLEVVIAGVLMSVALGLYLVPTISNAAERRRRVTASRDAVQAIRDQIDATGTIPIESLPPSTVVTLPDGRSLTRTVQSMSAIGLDTTPGVRVVTFRVDSVPGTNIEPVFYRLTLGAGLTGSPVAPGRDTRP